MRQAGFRVSAHRLIVTYQFSKETLNHRAAIEAASGLDADRHTPEAYRLAYEAPSIGLANRIPTENAPANC